MKQLSLTSVYSDMEKLIRTISCKLRVSREQARHIDETLRAFADATNSVMEYGRSEKVSNQFKLHKAYYVTIRKRFGLSANLAVRAIARASVALRDKKKRESFFNPTSIDYDARIFSLKLSDNLVSITLLKSRVKFFLNIGEFQHKALEGQSPTSATLCKKKSGYFLDIQIKEPRPETILSVNFIGVDLGVKSVAVLSDGTDFCSKELNSYRLKRHKVRKSLQSKAHKGTRSTAINCRRILKRLSGKQRRAAQNVNHTISKRIVEKAKETKSVIVMEDLTGIRTRANKRLRKSQRGLHNTWSFYQLRQFVTYKASRAGVQVLFVEPRYTSQTCHKCLHIGKRSGKHFSCPNCGNVCDADFNAANTIATVGRAINHAEDSILCCAFPHNSNSELKPIGL